FFFFQAEDGIRDRTVTGVQTCALPILKIGGDPQIFIGSADWMDRNLSRRVEVVWPMEQPDLKQRLIDILNTSLSDNVKARELLPDGSYRRVAAPAATRPQDGVDGATLEPPRLRSQERFLDLAAQNA